MKASRWLLAGFAVLALATGGLTLLQQEQVEHGNVSFDLSPDGKRLAFSAADGDLYLFDLRSRAVARLTRTRAVENGPTFSPDGKSLVYAREPGSGKGAALFTLRLSDRKVRQLTHPSGRSDGQPRFSADGRQIAFVAAHRFRPYSMGGWIWDQYDVYVMRADGSGARRLTRASYYQASRPNLTPDGKSVLFAAALPYSTPSAPKNLGGSITTLMEVSAAGGPPRPLGPLPPTPVETGAWSTDPMLSRDGTRLAFISDREREFDYQVHLMNRNGSGIRVLKSNGRSSYNQNPTLRPDGKAVLFLSGTEANAASRPIFSLWEVPLDGTAPRQLADSGLFTDPGRWSKAHPPAAGAR